MMSFYKDPVFVDYITKKPRDVCHVRTYFYNERKGVDTYTTPLKLHKHEYLQTMFKFKNLTPDKINQLTIDFRNFLRGYIKEPSHKVENENTRFAFWLRTVNAEKSIMYFIVPRYKSTFKSLTNLADIFLNQFPKYTKHYSDLFKGNEFEYQLPYSTIKGFKHGIDQIGLIHTDEIHNINFADRGQFHNTVYPKYYGNDSSKFYQYHHLETCYPLLYPVFLYKAELLLVNETIPTLENMFELFIKQKQINEDLNKKIKALENKIDSLVEDKLKNIIGICDKKLKTVDERIESVNKICEDKLNEIDEQFQNSNNILKQTQDKIFNQTKEYFESTNDEFKTKIEQSLNESTNKVETVLNDSVNKINTMETRVIKQTNNDYLIQNQNNNLFNLIFYILNFHQTNKSENNKLNENHKQILVMFSDHFTKYNTFENCNGMNFEVIKNIVYQIAFELKINPYNRFTSY